MSAFEQPSLFGDYPGRYHHDGHDTELASAQSIAHVSGQLRQQVLALLVHAGYDGLTDDEGGALMGTDRLTFGRRRNELVAAGYVVKTDTRRLTPTGRNAIVWCAVQYPPTAQGES